MSEFIDDQIDISKNIEVFNKKTSMDAAKYVGLKARAINSFKFFDENLTKEDAYVHDFQLELKLESTEDLNQKLRNEIEKYKNDYLVNLNWSNRWENLMNIISDDEHLEDAFKDLVALAKLKGYKL